MNEALGEQAVGSYGGGSFAEQQAMNEAMNAQSMQSMQDAQQADTQASQDAANDAGASAAESAGPSGAGTADGGDGWARGGIAALASGGLGSLGGYSDGGRLLRGPGDGVSDSIPATIGRKRPARLADGEFVVPARIVSELGNGSTEAGARQLYAMMDRIQAGRKKTVGKNKTAVNSRSVRHLPA
jgi:hypothetical protein